MAIVRMDGGQHLQVLSMWNRHEQIHLYRARQCDSYGRGESDFSKWNESIEEAKQEALELPNTKKMKK